MKIINEHFRREKGGKMFAVKRAVLEALLNDSEWLAKLEKAKSFGEVEKVLRKFAEAKKLKVKEIFIK